MQTFSLAYTSCRPLRIGPMVLEWRQKAHNAGDVEVVIAVDEDNKEALREARLVPQAKVVIQADKPYNCVKGWNLAAAETTGKVILAISDDMHPPQDWDQSLRALPIQDWMERDHAVHVEDGYVHDLCVLPILTRKRYERYGYLLYPEYESMFSDTEFGDCARSDGVLIEATHLLFEHRHPDAHGKRQRDMNDIVHASEDRWKRGELLYNYRKYRGFRPDDEKAAPEPVATKKAEFAVYIQANKDDFCLFEVCQRLYEEGLRDFFFAIPSEYWSGKSTSSAEIAQVGQVADQVRALEGTAVSTKIFDVSKYRFTGDTRISVETRVRNDSLAWVRRSGFTHILVVDGDELWMRGLYAMILQIVKDHRPDAISAPMIPVVGLPGYPIDRASDRAVVYIGGSAWFKECRTPQSQQVLINGLPVIHFTATRRTMQEIVDKHKESGHYDDPDYDFDTFIEKVLPNVRPGYRYNWGNHEGIHFFKRYQIWPDARVWSLEEYAQIPFSLRAYLSAP